MLSDSASYNWPSMATFCSRRRRRYAPNTNSATTTRQAKMMANTASNVVVTTAASARTFSAGTTLHTYQYPLSTGATHT